MNGCWILSNAFPASTEMTIWSCFFGLLLWQSTLIDFQMLKQPCIPVMSSSWRCYVFLFICCWIGFANSLLRIVASICMRVHSFTHLWSTCLEQGVGRPTGEDVNSDLKELMSDPQGHTDCLTSLQKIMWLKKENVLPIGYLSGVSVLPWELGGTLSSKDKVGVGGTEAPKDHRHLAGGGASENPDSYPSPCWLNCLWLGTEAWVDICFSYFQNIPESTHLSPPPLLPS